MLGLGCMFCWYPTISACFDIVERWWVGGGVNCYIKGNSVQLILQLPTGTELGNI